MIIKNRVADLSMKVLASDALISAQDAPKKSPSGDARTYASFSNSPVHYGKTASADYPKSNSAGMSTPPLALTKIATFLRQLLPQLFSRFLQNNLSSNRSGGDKHFPASSQQQGSGKNITPSDFSRFSSMKVKSLPISTTISPAAGHPSTTRPASGTVALNSTDKMAPTAVAPGVPVSKSSDLSGITGFAKSANTTGGAGGKVVDVSTVQQLQESLTGNAPTTIRLAKDLSSTNKVIMKFGANKTIMGTPKGMGLHNIYLASDKTAGNDVFQNLNFTHDARYRDNGDIPLFISRGSSYWINHDTFSGTKDKVAGGLDKLLYVGGTADNVTLSNSLFKDNEYGVILGQPDDSTSAKKTYGGYPRMTIANNVFNNLNVRSPGLMRQGKFDVYNNSIENFHLGFSLASNATVLSQANYFYGGYDVHHKSSNTGVLDDKGDAAGFKDVGSNVTFKQSSPTTNWVPKEYTRSIKTPGAANAYNLANAGAGR